MFQRNEQVIFIHSTSRRVAHKRRALFARSSNLLGVFGINAGPKVAIKILSPGVTYVFNTQAESFVSH